MRKPKVVRIGGITMDNERFILSLISIMDPKKVLENG